jgi:hypothetical protein
MASHLLPLTQFKDIQHALNLVLGEDDEDDDLLAIEMIYGEQPSTKRSKYQYPRIDWQDHLQELHAAGPNEFHIRYHMSEDAFNRLVEVLGDSIQVNEIKSRASTKGNSPITPTMITAVGVRYLGGEYNKSLRDIFKVSPSSIKRMISIFLVSVLECKQLEINLPKTINDIVGVATGFDSISTAVGQPFHGCVGALDGWLVKIQQPSKTGTVNDADYFSGHYSRYGLNVQAVLDAACNFQYIAVAAPGRRNDVMAYEKCEKLVKWVENLPDNYFIVADAAYILSNHLLVPYTSTDQSNVHKLAFNYHLSQLRIRTEMGFGRMTQRWGLFERNMKTSLPMCATIIQCAARLHNFIQDVDGMSFYRLYQQVNGINDDDDDENNNDNYLTSEPEGTVAATGSRIRSFKRESILAEIVARDTRRPFTIFE